MIDLDHEFKAPEDVMFRDLGGEAVLLNVSTGRYFGLDEIATHMWSAIGRERRLRKVVDEIVEEYEIDRSTVVADLKGLVSELLENRLLVRIEPIEVEAADSLSPSLDNA